MTEKYGIDALYDQYGNKMKIESFGDRNFKFDRGGVNLTPVPFMEFGHDINDSVESFHDKINNPTKLFGAVSSPYILLAYDSVGDSEYEGGVTMFFGYQYASDDFGAQMLMKYNGAFKFRKKTYGTWSEWKNISLT